MNRRVAILDLGTNTFHLLIAELLLNHSFQVLFKTEEFVHLGESGLGLIGTAAFERGKEQIRKFKEIIDKYQPEIIAGFGTAAIRRATNGNDFVEAVKQICPMTLRIISGEEEAELIYLGVRQAVPLNDSASLIIDIGGGSTEFIIANNNELLWKQSFPIGASVLKQKFHHHDPILPQEVNQLEQYLGSELQPLILQQEKFHITQMIGASGSFDTFASLIVHRFFNGVVSKNKTFFEMNPGVVFLGSELEFNSMTKYFYADLSLPKKKLSEGEMLEINRLYRVIGRCQQQLAMLQKP